MNPILETIASDLPYGDLPETWRVPNAERFSAVKSLYDYQHAALKNAARALFLYYGEAEGYRADASSVDLEARKFQFEKRYSKIHHGELFTPIEKYEKRADEEKQKANPVFEILAEYFPHSDNRIAYRHLLNRMCFWMATGSGKTLVMVKLLDYIYRLQQNEELPSHKILLLAPTEHLIGQIKRTVHEFNAAGGLQINLIQLRQANAPRQMHAGDSVEVYYHRSDNISDQQKDALTDYRMYENDGKWFVLLDEAHKGGKEDSKRQAYYAVLARAGFLFNFSATFTDTQDIVTTVKKYNLQEFVRNAYGKNIYINAAEFTAFQKSTEDINATEKKRIVLKSLLTLAYISRRIEYLRAETGYQNLYHKPLLLTLVNSVNTDAGDNDLLAFFQTLRELANDEIDSQIFSAAKEDLINTWRDAELLFRQGTKLQMDAAVMRAMTIAEVRAAIFLSKRRGELQVIRSHDKGEVAFQLRNADAPFALIRIGDTKNWRNDFLQGFLKIESLRERSFFSELERSNITILMGSRAFVESWDSNRPNVINFINIGGAKAKKFVMQAIGRGVRIETLPNQRRRLEELSAGAEKQTLRPYVKDCAAAETLFVFATNRNAIQTVLDVASAESEDAFIELHGFEKTPLPTINAREMPLLIPRYKKMKSSKGIGKFSMSKPTHARIQKWFARTSDSVFIVRDGLSTDKITAFREMLQKGDGIRYNEDKNYASLPFLQSRLTSHMGQPARAADGVRKVADEDIVHFQHVQVAKKYAKKLQHEVHQVKQGAPTPSKIADATAKYEKSNGNTRELEKVVTGKDKITGDGYEIEKLLGHYYLPVVLGSEAVNYIRHVIKVPSEVNFLRKLESLCKEKMASWDAWMFSKIDESLDKIYIPYYDTETNEYRKFIPDFVFWLCRGNEYRVVLVDPKGTTHSGAYVKIDGYKEIFERGETPRRFSHDDWKVSVHLLMFNEKETGLKEYQKYWTDSVDVIFAE